MKTIFGSIIATITGNLAWVLGLINLVFLLVRSHTLFSWWWVIISAVIFVVSLILALIGVATEN